MKLKRWPFILLIAALVLVVVGLRMGRAPDKPPAPPPTATVTDTQMDARTIATTWMRLYLAGPSASSQEAWLLTLGDYTTTDFYKLLQDTDRQNLPTAGLVSVSGSQTPTRATMTARMSDGKGLVVTLTRATGQAPWLVSDIRPDVGI